MLFLRNERFFLLKRIYLITGILVSFFLPLVTFHYQVEIPSPAAAPVFPLTNEQSYPAPILTPVSKSLNYSYLLACLYLAGILFLIMRNIRQFSHLFKAIKKSGITKLGTAKLIRTSEYTSSFSFFNYVFVNPSVSEDEVKEIMNHELVHVNQKHWFDLVLGEFLRMLQWANPFAWIYTGFMRLNHEYLADEEALERSSDPALYKAALLNQLFRSPVVSLSNSFNYSITKTRFDMMKKIVSSPYRKLKVLLILPVFAVIFYAFSAPEYRYTSNTTEPFTIYESNPVRPASTENPSPLSVTPATPQSVKGVIKDADGKPIPGAVVVITGAVRAPVVTSDVNGNFNFPSVASDASLFISAPGFKSLSVKPDFSKTIEIKLEKDPDYKPATQVFRPEPLVVINGEVSDKNYTEVRKELGHDFGTMAMLQGKAATDKYGEKGANGVIEILTRKKAIEMGLNPPYPRIGPEDFPTFQGKDYFSFNNWVSNKIVYPEEAKSKGLQGWVTVNYVIQKDGSVTIQEAPGETNQIFRDEIVSIINSAPKFEPPKNPEANESFNTSLTIGFRLPDKIIANVYVVVEQMPMYPGGDAALLQYIKDNTKYPDELKKDKIEGRVILRFVVTSEGTTEGISVLKGVHPLLDAQAIKIVGSLKGWTPGMQSGQPVNVWYMVPVNFTAPTE
jgi:TonB family protein